MQSYTNIEHIINDSYSTDRTPKILEEYIARNASRYPIRVIQSPARGVGNALNTGAAVASGDIIHFLHSDDYYLDADAISRAVSYFAKNPRLVWLTGNFLVEVRGRKIIIPHTSLLKIHPPRAISIMNIIHHENTFMKREELLSYGGFCEDKRYNVEYGLWLRLIRDHRPLVVNDQFTVFIIHNGSTSTGNIFRFGGCILRAFRTLRREKVVPLVGNYQEIPLYKNSMRWFKSIYSLGLKF